MIELDRDINFEDYIGTSQGPREIELKEHPFFIPMPIDPSPISSPIVDQHLVATTDDEPIEDVDPIPPYVDPIALDVTMDIPLRRSERAHKPPISYDYIVYLQEHKYDVGNVSYLTTYKEAIVSPQSNFWINAMKDEMTSMS